MTKRIGFKENKKCNNCDNIAWFELDDITYCDKCWDERVK